MKIYYTTKGITTTIFLLFILMNVTFAQSTPAVKAPQSIQVNEEVKEDKIILSFPNIIGKTQSDIERFENKINQAGFLGLIEAKIDPKSNEMTAVFRKDAVEESFLAFFIP